ncbi:hypothetical protein [Pseudomonas sp. NPDC086251]|uniref:hypothetical protein n=1 Tax=Pseudomonas sp. NPDC086251 TaxID=3364431 RepID=UPI003836B21B
MLEIAQLSVLLLAPFTLSLIVVLSVFHKGKVGAKELLDTLHLHPDNGLVKQPLFWLSICAPAFYFIATGAVCWHGYEVSISAQGFSKFISISALPLALLSLAIPLGVTVARFHSTEQTAKQISIAANQLSIAQLKNNADAFYSHRKEFFAYFDKIGTINFLDSIEVKYQINPRLHGLIFKGNPETGTPKINAELISELVSKIKFIRNCLDHVLQNLEPERTLTWYTTAASDIYWIAVTLGISEINKDLNNASVTLTAFYQDGTAMRQRSIGTTTVQAISAYRCAKSYILTILHFAGDEKSIDEIYDGALPHIDTTSAYLRINTNGLVIDRNFSGDSETPWNVAD